MRHSSFTNLSVHDEELVYHFITHYECSSTGLNKSYRSINILYRQRMERSQSFS